jgi:hypothetical protein
MIMRKCHDITEILLKVALNTINQTINLDHTCICVNVYKVDQINIATCIFKDSNIVWYYSNDTGNLPSH